jgi:hypothetical protein
VTSCYRVGVGQSSVTYEFRAVDVTGIYRMTLHPVSGSAPTLSHNATASISRKVTGLTLPPSQADLFDPISDRVQINMVLGGESYPLGQYMPVDDTVSVGTDGVSGSQVASYRPVSLYDEMYAVAVPMSATFAGNGENAEVVARRLVDPYVTNGPVIERSPYSIEDVWSVGDDRGKALSDIATSGAYFSPWMDNANTLRMVQAFDPAERMPDFDYDAQPIVIRDSITITDGSVSAPNRYIAVNSDGATEQAYVGIYDVPLTAPYSATRRGYILPEIVKATLTSREQANAYARTYGIQADVAVSLTCSTLPTPGHDGYDVVRLLGELWLETSWSLQLTPDGPMQHTMTRAYESESE